MFASAVPTVDIVITLAPPGVRSGRQPDAVTPHGWPGPISRRRETGRSGYPTGSSRDSRRGCR
jgi:hypothetical protein